LLLLLPKHKGPSCGSSRGGTNPNRQNSSKLLASCKSNVHGRSSLYPVQCVFVSTYLAGTVKLGLMRKGASSYCRVTDNSG
jgi:hypothetical protein